MSASRFGKCETVLRDTKIPVEENGKKLTFVNPAQLAVRKIKVDDCAIRTGLRCDWLIIEPNSVEHYVELKGGDVEHAVKQIVATIREISVDSKNQKKHAHIVSAHVPALATRMQARWKRDFLKNFNSSFNMKSRQSVVNI